MDEVFNSKNSNSTQASAFLTKKGSLQIDTESIEAQLDRLNFAVLGVLKPEDKELCDSFSFQGYDAFMDSEDIIEGTEQLEYKHERSLMILEDFRSHEFRKDRDNTKQLRISCKLGEMYKLKSDISKMIEIIEKKISNQVTLELGGVKILIDIYNHTIFASKADLCSNFLTNNTEASHYLPYIKQLENEVEELTHKKYHDRSLSDIEKNMFQAYQDDFFIKESSPLINPSSLSSNFYGQRNSGLEIEYRSKRQLHLTREALVKEIEWECAQNKIVKANYETKVKILEEKEAFFKKSVNEFSNEIQKRIKIIEIEKNKIQNERNSVYEKEKNIRIKLNSIKDEANALIDALKIEENFITPVNTPCITPRHNTIEESNDPVKIEEEIRGLESDLELAQDKNSINFKINRLKNKLSAIKTEKALNSSVNVKRLSSFNGQRNIPTTPRAFFPAKLDISIDLKKTIVPNTPKMNNRAFTCFTGRNNTDVSSEFSPQTTIRSHYQPDTQEISSKDDNLSKMLELKDLRLRKKEDELNKREIKLQNTWIKLPNANELIPMVQNELINYQNKSLALDKVQHELEIQIKENLENKKKIQEIESKYAKMMKNIEEKTKIAEKLEDLILTFDEISI